MFQKFYTHKNFKNNFYVFFWHVAYNVEKGLFSSGSIFNYTFKFKKIKKLRCILKTTILNENWKS